MGRCLPKSVWLFVYGMTVSASPNHTLPFVQPSLSVDYLMKAKSRRNNYHKAYGLSSITYWQLASWSLLVHVTPPDHNAPKFGDAGISQVSAPSACQRRQKNLVVSSIEYLVWLRCEREIGIRLSSSSGHRARIPPLIVIYLSTPLILLLIGGLPRLLYVKWRRPRVLIVLNLLLIAINYYSTPSINTAFNFAALARRARSSL